METFDDAVERVYNEACNLLRKEVRASRVIDKQSAPARLCQAIEDAWPDRIAALHERDKASG